MLYYYKIRYCSAMSTFATRFPISFLSFLSFLLFPSDIYYLRSHIRPPFAFSSSPSGSTSSSFPTDFYFLSYTPVLFVGIVFMLTLFSFVFTSSIGVLSDYFEVYIS